MPISIQRYVDGNRYVIACVCCNRDIRVATKGGRKAALQQWDGCQGNFNGHREFICKLCIDEAAGLGHVGGWRW